MESRSQMMDTWYRIAIQWIACSGIAVMALPAKALCAAITVEFKHQANRPITYEVVMVQIRAMATQPNTSPFVVEDLVRQSAFKKTYERLKPGKYVLRVYTGEKYTHLDASRPGAFNSTPQLIYLESETAHKEAVILYQPIDTSTVRGTEQAKGVIKDPLGNPVADLGIRIAAGIPRAGYLTIERSKTDSAGRFTVNNLSSDGLYIVRLPGNERLGALKPSTTTHYTLNPPVGMLASNIGFVDLVDTEERRLGDFKGKFVVLELWASWCRPCYETMDQMQHLKQAHAMREDEVEFITLNIDDTPDLAKNHLERNGWNKTYNTWAGKGGFSSDAAKALDLKGIPMAYVIDKDGRIVAQGHPKRMDIPGIVYNLLEE